MTAAARVTAIGGGGGAVAAARVTGCRLGLGRDNGARRLKSCRRYYSILELCAAVCVAAYIHTPTRCVPVFVYRKVTGGRGRAPREGARARRAARRTRQTRVAGGMRQTARALVSEHGGQLVLRSGAHTLGHSSQGASHVISFEIGLGPPWTLHPRCGDAAKKPYQCCSTVSKNGDWRVNATSNF